MVNSIEMLDSEEYQALSPDAKEKYISETLNELLHENPEGMTKSDILEETPFGRKTVEKHLEKLIALNEGYVRRMGNTDVYYPNGKLLHSDAIQRKEIDGKTFQMKGLENISGQSYYLQEVESGKYGDEIKGGLLIPKDHFSEFVDWLQSVEERGDD